MAAPIVAVGNFKGGTGKSTLAVNLACTLASGGKQRVVLVDADAQGTGVEWVPTVTCLSRWRLFRSMRRLADGG